MTTVYENKCMYYEKSHRAKNPILPRIISDHLGSIRVVLNEQGNVDSWSDYYPHGKESRSGSSGNKPKEQFTGKEHDSETTLDYFGARYYNSDIVRWLSVDPLKEKHPDWNPYNYVLGNPMILIDPDGKQVSYLAREVLNYAQQNTSSSVGQFFIGVAQGVVNAVPDNITTMIDATNSAVDQYNQLSEGNISGAMGESQLSKTIEGIGSTISAAWNGDANAIGQIVGTVGAGLAVGKAVGGAVTESKISVYHGSIDDFSKISTSGLEANKGTAFVSRDINAAKDAIGGNRYEVSQGLAKDPGIVKSNIPKSQFNKLLKPNERSYTGFGGKIKSSEIPLRTNKEIDLFNKNIEK